MLALPTRHDMSTTIQTLHLQDVIQKHTRDMSGRVAAITGTTSGTGYVCARELARLGAKVILLNRASDRSTAALHKLRDEVPDGDFDPVVCDLQDFESVRAATADIVARYDKLDVLCNNAGVMALPDQATKDGYDVQMQTNCLSHFLLTKNLIDLLAKSDDARVVSHTSMARLGGPIAARYFTKAGGNLGGDGTAEESASFSGPRWERYHQTKLANCTFTFELKRRLEASGKVNVKPMIAHPGLSRTNLQVTTADTGGMDIEGEFMGNAQSAEDGATGILRACADPEAVAGDFFGPKGWTGFPERLEVEPLLVDPENLRVSWDGFEAAVGAFEG